MMNWQWNITVWRKLQEGSIELQNEDGELDGLTEAGIKRAKEEAA